MGTVSDYVATLDDARRPVVERVVEIAREVAPDAEEGMSYGMPALRVDGRPLVAVTSAAKHLSLFPFSPAVIEAVAPDLEGYSLSKGTIRFSPDQPLPDAVVRRVVELRLAEVRAARS